MVLKYRTCGNIIMEGTRGSFAPAIMVLKYNTFSTNIDGAKESRTMILLHSSNGEKLSPRVSLAPAIFVLMVK
jgi:hypothetical protein